MDYIGDKIRDSVAYKTKQLCCGDNSLFIWHKHNRWSSAISRLSSASWVGRQIRVVQYRKTSLCDTISVARDHPGSFWLFFPSIVLLYYIFIVRLRRGRAGRVSHLAQTRSARGSQVFFSELRPLFCPTSNSGVDPPVSRPLSLLLSPDLAPRFR